MKEILKKLNRASKYATAAGALCVAFGLGYVASHESIARADRESPYITLYKLRVAQAQANVSRKQALSQLADSKYARGQRLIQSAAMSQEEYDTLSAEATAATADVELAKQKVDEAQAYLQIIEGLVARGVNIPLCTYEME